MEHEPVKAEQALLEHGTVAKLAPRGTCPAQGAAACSWQVPWPPVLANRFSCPSPQRDLPHRYGVDLAHSARSCQPLWCRVVTATSLLWCGKQLRERSSINKSHRDASALLSWQLFQRRAHNRGHPTPLLGLILSCSRD